MYVSNRLFAIEYDQLWLVDELSRKFKIMTLMKNIPANAQTQQSDL